MLVGIWENHYWQKEEGQNKENLITLSWLSNGRAHSAAELVVAVPLMAVVEVRKHRQNLQSEVKLVNLIQIESVHSSDVICNLHFVSSNADGLWPDYNDGTWPACCTGKKFEAKEVSTLLGALNKYWPTLSCGSTSNCHGGKGLFWEHEVC
ncbi:hypothetical protein RD792_010187 [Penstemon davidsonii]|uniref:Uncharacterized protein n=1 Tax=Penstemon davidsonii TaxID=160366 RepID=A0ABR0D2J2_9LAMI|nr:hypothetical protein RD792_010187 [Penstemon davidsonii]